MIHRGAREDDDRSCSNRIVLSSFRLAAETSRLGRRGDRSSNQLHPRNPRFTSLLRNFPRNLAPAFTHYLSERPEMSSQRREVTEGQNNERKFSNMKNRNTQLTAILFVVAFALASIVQAGPRLDGGPIRPPANEAPYLTVAQPTCHLLCALMRTAKQSPRVKIAR